MSIQEVFIKPIIVNSFSVKMMEMMFESFPQWVINMFIMQGMAIPVVEFSREGYRIRQVFG